MKKETKVQISIIIVLSMILGGLLIIARKQVRMDNKRMNLIEEETDKETAKDDIETGAIVNEKKIYLDDYTSNITITDGGEYTVTGEFAYTILIQSKEDVTLNLNGVSINSTKTAAIANIGTGSLKVNLMKETTNTLKDNGSSEYDACLYSISPLTIEGEGTLKVYGNQSEGEGIATETANITINSGILYIEAKDDGINAGGDGGTITINGGSITIKAQGDGIDSNKNLIVNAGTIYTMGSPIGGDAGIDTDEGFEIHGGYVIALGSDMLETPKSTSQQISVFMTLKTTISNGSTITLKDTHNKEICTFVAEENFKTLIISHSQITKGTYQLYINNEKTDYSQTIK